jgi:20S proteasome alpha/beta subunit
MSARHQLTSRAKYNNHSLNRQRKMTGIIGGKCIDGVVLVADRKVICNNGSVESREKIFKDYHPFVVASSGSTLSFDNFRKDARELAQESLGFYADNHEFKRIPFNPKNISGIAIRYPIETSYPVIQFDSYLKGLIAIIKKYKRETARDSSLYSFDVLVASRTDSEAYLGYIDDYGMIMNDIDKYIMIGSEKTSNFPLLKPLWNSNMKMNEFAELAYFIIKYVDRFKTDDTVGLEGDKPLVWLIPNKGDIDKAPNDFIEEWEYNTNKMLDNLVKYGIKKLL